MTLSENAHVCLNAIGADPKPFRQETLKKYRTVPGCEEFLVEREEGGPVPTAEGLQVILSRIAEDARARKERERLMTVLQGGQADTARQKHGKTE